MGINEDRDDLDDRVEVGLIECRGISECVESLEDADVGAREEEVEGRRDEEAIEAAEDEEGRLFGLELL